MTTIIHAINDGSFMPFACIFVPDFPVEAVLRAEPELRAQPVAVLEGKPPLQKVLGVNERARQLGIEVGMTKIQVEPFTQLTLRVRSPLQEASAHAALLDCAQSFSPRVEDTASDTVILDLAGLESLFGPTARIARELARRTSDLGLEAHVAVAGNPDAAHLAARGFSGVTVIPDGNEAERLGSLPLDVLFPEFRAHSPALEVKPANGVRSPQRAPGTSAALNTAHAGTASTTDSQADAQRQKAARAGQPKSGSSKSESQTKSQKAESQEGARLLETLDLWGVRTLRALAELPEIALSQRLGQSGIHLQQLARGAVQRTLVPVELALVFEEAAELENPIVLLEPLALLLSHMLEQLCMRLAARALAAQELHLRFELDSGFYFAEDMAGPEAETTIEEGAERSARGKANDGAEACGPRSSHFTRTLCLPVPMLDAKTFLKLLQLDLKAHPPGAPIQKVYLSAEPARPRAAQGGLFQPPSPEPEKLELTLARIAGLVGAGNVGAAELLDTHHPEGFRMQRFVPPAEERSRKGKRDGSHHDASADGAVEAPVTALRIYRPPVRATVTVHDGKPVHIACPRRKEIQGDILWIAGPWRSSGDWWEKDGWSRDEWDIALQLTATSNRLPERNSLTLYRLVHDLLSGRWFVEGTYD